MTINAEKSLEEKQDTWLLNRCVLPLALCYLIHVCIKFVGHSTCLRQFRWGSTKSRIYYYNLFPLKCFRVNKHVTVRKSAHFYLKNNMCLWCLVIFFLKTIDKNFGRSNGGNFINILVLTNFNTFRTKKKPKIFNKNPELRIF